MHARAKAGESPARYRKGISITIESNQFEAGESVENSLGMTGHSQGRVNKYRTVALECGGKQLNGSLELYRDMDLTFNHEKPDRSLSSDPHPVRPDTGEVAAGLNGWESGARH